MTLARRISVLEQSRSQGQQDGPTLFLFHTLCRRTHPADGTWERKGPHVAWVSNGDDVTVFSDNDYETFADFKAVVDAEHQRVHGSNGDWGEQ